MRPNTMNKYGAVLDDFGLETMLDKLMDDFIRPISRGITIWVDCSLKVGFHEEYESYYFSHVFVFGVV